MNQGDANNYSSSHRYSFTFSESMKLALDEGNDDELVILYLHLYEDELDTEHSIVGSLKNIKGSSLLKMYVTSLAQFWFDILHSHFQK